MKKTTVLQTPHDKCTGCAACMNCCPVGAIEMKPDKKGFLFPKIDERGCVLCGKCSDVCPVLKERPKTKGSPECYAAWSKDEDIRSQSSSGGVFSHLAQCVIKLGGVVTGASFKEDFLVEHSIARTVPELGKLRRSKYIQSEIGDIFRKIKKELLSEKQVLFVGTPCQCEGLRAFLENDYDNLYLCDFICHGVNSPTVFLTYLHELEEKYGAKASEVSFRDKSSGWKNYSIRIEFKNGKEYLSGKDSDLFMFGFCKRRMQLYLRASCYRCKFRNAFRNTDITLGDFWGVEKHFPEFDINRGVSAVMIHSDKGKQLFESCGSEIFAEKCELHQISSGNESLEKNPDKTGNTDIFWNWFLEKEESFSNIFNKLK